jgi:NarL family two-component system response regulator LiaR
MIRVLIVDDHTVVRKGLQSLLSSEKYDIQVIGDAGDGNQAVQMALELQPDVILMDLQMPGKSGLEAIQEIKQQGLAARILVLTSFGEDERVAAALRAGALGYLLKDSFPDELVSAIHAVALGHLSIPQELSSAILGVQRPIVSSSGENPLVDLTAREVEVLRCLASGASNNEIASQLSISLTTVRTHVSSILRKLNLENRTQAALFARQQGLDQ